MDKIIAATIAIAIVAPIVGVGAIVAPMAILMAMVSPVVLPGTWWIAVVMTMVFAAWAGVSIYREMLFS